MKKILILGASGMLGSMVFDRLSSVGSFEVRGTVREIIGGLEKHAPKLFLFNAEREAIKESIFNKWQPDFIINCIGVIKPYCKDGDEKGIMKAIRLNALFPHILAQEAEAIKARVIQIATDCVWSGVKGNYTENDPHDAYDVYGKTKSLGEVTTKNFLNIRCSIIGFELKGKVSLLEWFLGLQDDSTVKGFQHHRWNGVTTLQFADICAGIINAGARRFDDLVSVSSVHHFIPNASISKYELLLLFNATFGRTIIVIPVSNEGPTIDRTLATTLDAVVPSAKQASLEKALAELKAYMGTSDLFGKS